MKYTLTTPCPQCPFLESITFIPADLDPLVREIAKSGPIPEGHQE